MDGRQFDALTRAFAGKESRRRFLFRSAVATGVAGSLAGFDSASAARRGNNGVSSICRPDGAGGYYRDSVPTVSLQAALNAGAIISDCCAHAECGTSGECVNAVCDFGAGACSVTHLNGNTCTRPGCVDGACSGGACADPIPHICGDGVCNTCSYDSCSHTCDCDILVCYTEDYQCMDAYCSSDDGGCVSYPINEGGACDTFGVAGVCTLGFCTSV